MTDTEFRLEVGKEYIDGRGERHLCEEYDSGQDVFRCNGEETGAGWYFATGQTYVGRNAQESESFAPHMTPRPITD